MKNFLLVLTILLCFLMASCGVAQPSPVPPAASSSSSEVPSTSASAPEDEVSSESLEEEDDTLAASNYEDYDFLIRQCLEKRMETITILCENGFKPPDNEQFLYIYSLPHSHSIVSQLDDETTEITYEILYYPGTRIADAYLSGDTSGLTDREWQVYDLAVDFLETRLFALQASPEQDVDLVLLQEREIHDFICESTKYYTAKSEQKMPDFHTVLGLFLDQKANCQGYADAFEMLCRMAGLEVGKVQGSTDGEGHVWNTFFDGENWFMVDVTWDDAAYGDDTVGYQYFNIGRHLISATHSWDERNLSYPVLDGSGDAYFYYAGAPFGYSFASREDAFDFLVEHFANQDTPVYLMCEGFVPPEHFGQQVANGIAEEGYAVSLLTGRKTVGENTYLYLELSEKAPF